MPSPSLVKLSGVPPASVHANWHRFYPFIKRVTDLSEEDPGFIYKAVMEEKAQLLIGTDEVGRVKGVCVTEIIIKGQRKVCNIWALAADVSRETFMPHLAQIEEWAKGQGCVAMRVAEARTAFKKLLKPNGYRVKRIVLEKEI